MNISRRRLIKVITVGGVLLQLRVVGAQYKLDPTVQGIAENEKDAKSLRAEVVKFAPEMNDALVGSIVGRETALRLRLLKTLERVPADKLLHYVSSDRQKLANALQVFEFPLRPDRNEIQAQVVIREAPPKECNESVVSVIADIFMEGLGLNEVQAAIKEVIKNSPEIQKKIDELGKALLLKDWEKVIDLVANIMDLLSDAGMADLFIKVLGKEQGWKDWHRLLATLRARFVPFVGQVYTAITVGVALFNNRERVLHVIKCANQ